MKQAGEISVDWYVFYGKQEAENMNEDREGARGEGINRCNCPEEESPENKRERTLKRRNWIVWV